MYLKRKYKFAEPLSIKIEDGETLKIFYKISYIIQKK